MNSRIQGTVKKYWPERGYGFVARDDGEDIFIAERELKAAGIDELMRGERVEFEVGTQRDGRTLAKQITRADGNAEADQVFNSPRYGDNPLGAG